MHFVVDYNDQTENRQLTYSLEEFSFDVEPIVYDIDFSLILNTINLTVADKKVVQVWGYCGNAMWEHISLPLINYQRGSLIIEDQLEPGFSHAIFLEEVPVFFDKQTGWICMGNRNAMGEAVEFINNCVAVINCGKFEALWLKPKWI